MNRRTFLRSLLIATTATGAAPLLRRVKPAARQVMFVDWSDITIAHSMALCDPEMYDQSGNGNHLYRSPLELKAIFDAAEEHA